MDRDLVLRWVHDLETTDVPQAKDVLFDGEGYCCLGRACVVAGIEPVKVGRDYAFEGEDIVLPDRLVEPLGVVRWNGTLSPPVTYAGECRETLTRLNDAGMPFPEIAKIIRQQILGEDVP